MATKMDMTREEESIVIEDMQSECHNAINAVMKSAMDDYKISGKKGKEMIRKAIKGLKSYMNL